MSGSRLIKRLVDKKLVQDKGRVQKVCRASVEKLMYLQKEYPRNHFFIKGIFIYRRISNLVLFGDNRLDYIIK